MKAVHILRKPCAEPTVVANVLTHGCGGLNIDAARIGTGADKGTWPITERRHADVAYTLQPVATDQNVGRWPANVILTHAPGCVSVGARVCRTADSKGAADYSVTGNQGPVGITRNVKTGAHYGDADGTETVAAYDCAPGCPVAALDAQSGILLGRGNRTSLGHGSGSGVTGWGKGRTDAPPRPELNDAGGASRFFKQFGGESA